MKQKFLLFLIFTAFLVKCTNGNYWKMRDNDPLNAKNRHNEQVGRSLLGTNDDYEYTIDLQNYVPPSVIENHLAGIADIADPKHKCNKFTVDNGRSVAILAGEGPFKNYYDFYDKDHHYGKHNWYNKYQNYNYGYYGKNKFECKNVSVALAAINERDLGNDTPWGGNDFHLVYLETNCNEILAKFALGLSNNDIVTDVIQLSVPFEYWDKDWDKTETPEPQEPGRRLYEGDNNDWDYRPKSYGYNNFRQGVCVTKTDKNGKKSAVPMVVSVVKKLSYESGYDKYGKQKYTKNREFELKILCQPEYSSDKGDITCNGMIPYYPKNETCYDYYSNNYQYNDYDLPKQIFHGIHETSNKVHLTIQSPYLNDGYGYGGTKCKQLCQAEFKLDGDVEVLNTEATLNGDDDIILGISYQTGKRIDTIFLKYNLWCKLLNDVTYRGYPNLYLTHLTSKNQDINNPPIFVPKNLTDVEEVNKYIPFFKPTRIPDSEKRIIHATFNNGTYGMVGVLNETKIFEKKVNKYGYPDDYEDKKTSQMRLICLNAITEVTKDKPPTRMNSVRFFYNTYLNRTWLSDDDILEEEFTPGNLVFNKFVVGYTGTNKGGGAIIIFSKPGSCEIIGNSGSEIQEHAYETWSGQLTVQDRSKIFNWSLPIFDDSSFEGFVNITTALEPGYITTWSNFKSSNELPYSTRSAPLEFGTQGEEDGLSGVLQATKRSTRSWWSEGKNCRKYSRAYGHEPCNVTRIRCEKQWWNSKDDIQDSSDDSDRRRAAGWETTTKDPWAKTTKEVWSNKKTLNYVDKNCAPDFWSTNPERWVKWKADYWSKNSHLLDCKDCGPTSKPTNAPSGWKKPRWETTKQGWNKQPSKPTWASSPTKQPSYTGRRLADSSYDSSEVTKDPWTKTTKWHAPTPKPTTTWHNDCPLERAVCVKEDDSSWEIGLILGISIPVGVLILCLLCCIWRKMKGGTRYDHIPKSMSRQDRLMMNRQIGMPTSTSTSSING